jgi:hypothetical protein
MPAPKGNEYAKGNRGGARPTKYKPDYPGMVRKLCEKGFTDEDIAETLGISISTLHQWKVKHEEFYEALQRGKDEANRCVENSLFKRANGFHYETEKVSNGRPMKVTEYALPDVGAQRLWLQNRMPEVYREQQNVKHTLNMDQAFLRFLDQMEEQAKLERAQNAKLIEHSPLLNEITGTGAENA